jgi:prevent-host-death family protein
MTTINIAETKAHLSKYINMAEFGGEEIVIQKHGRPVAALINIETYEKFKQLDKPAQEGKLVYKKLNYLEHIVKPSYTIDDILLLVGDDNTDVKPFADVEDVIAFSKELRNNAWKR